MPLEDEDSELVEAGREPLMSGVASLAAPSSSGDHAAMPSPRVLLVELDGLLAMHLSRRLAALDVEVRQATSVDAIDRLVSEPPDLAFINFELSQGSGFGLVNRVRRMEALTGLKLIIVTDNATSDAIEAHRGSPTPADAYVSRVHDSSTAAFAEVVFETAQRLLAEQLPEVEDGDVVELADKRDNLAEVVAELGGYRVLRRLQDEDGGAVFACMDEELDRAVAIKVMALADENEDEERLQRFQRERRILALLHSPYVVAVYGAGRHRGMPYLVRELIDGEDLERKLKRDGPLDVTTALQRARETALGLKHAADVGVIHRDVRPANIHVVDGHAKLARFGMGKRQSPDEQRITVDGLPRMELTYTAPERVRGEEDARSDIYALGVTLHTLIAGAPPFLKSPPIDPLSGRRIEVPISLESARAGTPPKVTTLVARLMAEAPEQRPQSYDEVIALIDDVTRASPAAASPAVEELEEPTAVHGTLRLMGVVEIVQSLELATRTAIVTLKGPEGSEGKLAFNAGRLVHASVDEQRGPEAFFSLVTWARGAFRVEYEASTLEHNVDTPTAGLLLEAARRADEAGARGSVTDPIPPERALMVEPSVERLEPGFFAAAGDRGHADDDAAGEDERAPAVSDSGVIDVEHTTLTQAQERPAPRVIASAWGFLILAVTTSLAVYGGLHLPAALRLPSDDDTAWRALDSLLDDTRTQLRAARLELAGVEPKLAEFEAQQASKASVDELTRTLVTEVHDNLEAALAPELRARRLTLRTSEDGGEAVIEIAEGNLFNGSGDEIVDEGKSALARITGAIASLRLVHVRVEGHTDDVEPDARSPHRNNWGLSGARARAVANVLTQGLPKERVSAVALAETMPVASNRGPKGRARNRRVELRLMPQVDAATLSEAAAATGAPAALDGG